MSNFIFSNSETGLTSSDDISIQIDNVDNEIAYGLYCKIKEYQFHYNSVKIKYKLLASTWVLATFFGIGFLLSGQETGISLNGLVIIGILGILSSIGLSLLFFLDVAVYHRLIEALFKGTLELEQKHSFLTRTNHNIASLLIKGKTGPVIYDGIFYAYFIFMMLLASNISFYMFLKQYNLSAAILIFTLVLIAMLAYSLSIVFFARESSLPKLFKKTKK